MKRTVFASDRPLFASDNRVACHLPRLRLGAGNIHTEDVFADGPLLDQCSPRERDPFATGQTQPILQRPSERSPLLALRSRVITGGAPNQPRTEGFSV
jgi:hypothetical protein